MTAWHDWLQFNDFIAPHVQSWWIEEVATTHDMLIADQGTEIGFVRLAATKPLTPQPPQPERPAT